MGAGSAVGGFHDADPRGGFAGGDQGEALFAADGVEELVEGGSGRLGELGPGLIAVGAVHFVALEVESSVGDVGVAFGAADQERDRIGDVHPTGGEGGHDSVAEPQKGFPGFIAIAVVTGDDTDVGGDPFDVAEEPHEDVEGVGTEVPEGAHAGDGGVGHPAPGVGGIIGFLIEPAPERAAVAVGTAGAGEGAEVAGGDCLFEEEMLGVGAHEIAGREEEAGVLDGGGHRPTLLGRDAEGLLDEHVFAGPGGVLDEIEVAVGFRTDDHGLHFRIGPDVLGTVGDRRFERLGTLFGTDALRVPDVFDLDIGATAQEIDEAGGMDMGAADQGQRELTRGGLRLEEGRCGHDGGAGEGRAVKELPAAEGEGGGSSVHDARKGVHQGRWRQARGGVQKQSSF